MEFSPAFALLRKFTVGLPRVPASAEDISAVAIYLGVDLEGSNIGDQEKVLSDELSKQNEFLSYELGSDAIFESKLYQSSVFVREVVANNRSNLKSPVARDG